MYDLMSCTATTPAPSRARGTGRAHVLGVRPSVFCINQTQCVQGWVGRGGRAVPVQATGPRRLQMLVGSVPDDHRMVASLSNSGVPLVLLCPVRQRATGWGTISTHGAAARCRQLVSPGPGAAGPPLLAAPSAVPGSSSEGCQPLLGCDAAPTSASAAAQVAGRRPVKVLPEPRRKNERKKERPQAGAWSLGG